MEEELNIGKTIAFWKRGTQPTVEKLIKVIKYLGLSADSILGIQTNNTNVVSNRMINVTEKRLLISKYVSDLKYIKNHLSILSGEDDTYEMIRDALHLMTYVDEQINKYENM